MSTQTVPPSTTVNKSVLTENGNGATLKPTSPPHHQQSVSGGERTVKKLRLTIPQGTTPVGEWMPFCLLMQIVTDKDIATRVIAEQTLVSKVTTRNPEALQKMVQGKFRHLPVVENGEVIALLDITKCLYDAISRMEKAAEQGSAITTVVEGVERQWGNNFSAPYAFIETLRDRMFKPALSTIIAENTKVALVSSSDPVYVAAKNMRDCRVNSVIISTGNKPQGILASKDVLMRVVAQNLSPELTLVEKVMTPNPECATLDTTILDALHIMHEWKFLHLPVVDKDGCIAACVDVLQITLAAISMVEGGPGAVNDVAHTMMLKFWDSALALEPPDDDLGTHSELSTFMTSDGAETGKSMYPSFGLGNSFAFKFEDLKGRVHRFNFGIESLDELITAVTQRMGTDRAHNLPQLLYEDDEGDKVILANDGDLIGAVSHLIGAVSHAKSAGLKMARDNKVGRRAVVRQRVATPDGHVSDESIGSAMA